MTVSDKAQQTLTARFFESAHRELLLAGVSASNVTLRGETPEGPLSHKPQVWGANPTLVAGNHGRQIRS
jgi:hypothetical protein